MASAQHALDVSLALPPAPVSAWLRLWERHTEGIVLEAEAGEFHFLCVGRSEAVCIVLPASCAEDVVVRRKIIAGIWVPFSQECQQ